MPTSEIILLSTDPKMGVVDMSSYCAIAEHALTNMVTTSAVPATLAGNGATTMVNAAGRGGQRSSSKNRGGGKGPMGMGGGGADRSRDVAKVAQQTDLLIYTILRQSGAVTIDGRGGLRAAHLVQQGGGRGGGTVSAAGGGIGNGQPQLDLSRPFVTLPFLSQWAQQAAAEGTVAMVVDELHRTAALFEGVGGRGHGRKQHGGVAFGSAEAMAVSQSHITLGVPCLAPSLLPHLLSRQQCVLDGQAAAISPNAAGSGSVGLPPIVACIEVTSTKASNPHGIVGTAQYSHSPAMLLALPGAPPVAKKGGGGSAHNAPPPVMAPPRGCSFVTDVDGSAQLRLPSEAALLDHNWLQLVRPLCAGPGGVTAAALAPTPAPPVATKNTAGAGKKGGKSAAAPAGAGGSSGGKSSSAPLPGSMGCNVLAAEHPLPRPVGLAIAGRIRSLLVTIHGLCVRYFTNSLTNPVLLDSSVMLNAAGLTYFDNCVSAFRRGERMRGIAATSHGASAPAAPTVAPLPGSKHGSRAAAAAAAAAASEQQAVRPEDKAALYEKELVEALLKEANKALGHDETLPVGAPPVAAAPAAPTQGSGKGSTAKAQSVSGSAAHGTHAATSAAALYNVLAAFAKHRYTSVVDVHVASLLVAVSSQLPVMAAIMHAYSAPMPQPPTVAANTKQSQQQQQQAPAQPRTQPCDFALVEAAHVRTFFSTPPPVQLVIPATNAKGGTAPIAVQTVPVATMANLPSVTLNIVASLCGVEEAIRGEVLNADGIVDTCAAGRAAPLFMMSAGDRLLAHLKADEASADGSLFRPKCPTAEVPLLWCPPQPQQAETPTVAAPPAPVPSSPSTGTKPQSKGAVASATAVVPDRTPQPSMGATAYQIGRAHHHDGCSVFKITVDPFPSAVVTSAVVCEGVRSAVVEMAKVRASTRAAPTAAPIGTLGARWDRAYQTLLEAPKGAGSASLRGAAMAVTAPAADAGDLLSAVVDRAVGSETLQMLEVVDVEKNNLRLLNRALAEARVRTAAADREKRQLKQREDTAGNEQGDVACAPPPKAAVPPKGGRDRTISPSSRKARAASVPPQAVEAPAPKDPSTIESLAEEARGNDVLRRADPLPRKTLANGQPSYLYVQPRADVVRQNAIETEALRAVLAPDVPKASGKLLAKRFVGAFFNKTFGGSVTGGAGFPAPSAAAARPLPRADPSGLVDDSTSPADGTPQQGEGEDTFAAQKKRVETVMVLRQISKVADAHAQHALDGHSLPALERGAAVAARRNEVFLQQLSRATLRQGDAADCDDPIDDPREGADDTGAIDMLSRASNQGPAGLRRASTNSMGGGGEGADVSAPPVGNSAQVTAWINKTLSPTEQQFLLDQAVLSELVKSQYPSLTPRFTTGCHYFSEDQSSPSGLVPCAVAARAEQLFALFPSNVAVAMAGQRLGTAMQSGTTEPLTRQGLPAFIRNSRLLDSVGYFTVGISPVSSAAHVTSQAGGVEGYHSDLPAALISNEKKRVGHWAYAAAVGTRPQYAYSASSIASCAAAYSRPANAVANAAGLGSGPLAASQQQLQQRPASAAGAATPLPQLRDEDAPWTMTMSQPEGQQQQANGGAGAVEPAPTEPFILPPTTVDPLFTLGQGDAATRPFSSLAGRRIVRGQRTMVMPYDGSVVEVTRAMGGHSNASLVKYHRHDVTVAAHYTTAAGGAVLPSHRLVASFHDCGGDTHTPLVTLEDGALSVTDRGADERLCSVTRLRGAVGASGVPSAPSLSFNSLSTDMRGAVGGFLTEGRVQVDDGRAPKDAPAGALRAIAGRMQRERAPLIMVDRQLRAVSSAAGVALAEAPPPVVVPTSPAKRSKSSPVGSSRSTSPAVQPQATSALPEVSAEKAMLAAAMGALTRVSEARCNAMATSVAGNAAAKMKRRAALPHYQNILLSLNAGAEVGSEAFETSHSRPAHTTVTGYSTWFERDEVNGTHALRTGLRSITDIEQSRDVCSTTGAVTIRYVSGSLSRLLPDGSTATLLSVPGDITTGYYTSVQNRGDSVDATPFVFAAHPNHPSVTADGWSLETAHTATGRAAATVEELRVMAAVAVAASQPADGTSAALVGGNARMVRPPSPNASRGTAVKAPAPAGARRQGAEAALNLAPRPPSATYLSAVEAASTSAPPAVVLGPLPVALPKYWLLTAPSGNRCARRCEGSMLDGGANFPTTSEWTAFRVHCNALMPAILTAADGLEPLETATSFDAQNLCQLVSRADGVVTAVYNNLSGHLPTSPSRARGDQASAQQELTNILQGTKDTKDKGSVHVAVHADGTTVVSVVPSATSPTPSNAGVPPNYIPIPTHLPALDGFVQFLATHAVDKCGGDITTIWPESLGLSHREGTSLFTSLAFLVEHPRFPRVVLRRSGAPSAPAAPSSIRGGRAASAASLLPFDTFAIFSDQSLLACEMVNVRIPASQHTKPAGYIATPGTAQDGTSAPQLPFFHTRFVRPNGTTLRIMNTTAFGATAKSSGGDAASPVLIVEPSSVAVSLNSPYRQLLAAVATVKAQERTSILGNVPTSLSGKARHLATIATSAALHEACPIFNLVVPPSAGAGAGAGAPLTGSATTLLRLVDKRNFVTTVSSKGLAVSFKRLNTEQLLMRLAPQGLVTHAVSKRRQQEEEARHKGKASAALLGRSSIGPLEAALRIIARSFIVKYALIGTPQIGVFHRAREDSLRVGGGGAAGKGTSQVDGGASMADSKTYSMSPSAAPSRASDAVGTGALAGMNTAMGFTRVPRENPAYMTEHETNEALHSLSYDYAPSMYVVRSNPSNPSAPVVYSQLLSAHDLAPYVRQTIARSNPGPTASDLTATANEEDDIADKCLSIFPSDAAGPVLSSVVTAGKSVVSGEPHIEQLQFYETYRMPATLKGSLPSSSAAAPAHRHHDPMGSFSAAAASVAVARPSAVPLHRPPQGICAWLPKTALPPKRLLLQQVVTGSTGSHMEGSAHDALAAAMAQQAQSQGTINTLGQGHSHHVTYASRQLLRFTRYSPAIRDAVAAVRLSAEAQRRSMVHYTRGVVAHTTMEEERNRVGGVDTLRAKYRRQLEAIQRGANPATVGMGPLSAADAEDERTAVASRDPRARSTGSMDDVDVGEDVMVLCLEGSPDSPRDMAGDGGEVGPEEEPASGDEGAGGIGPAKFRSTNTARERAVVYLNQRMVKPPCSAVIACEPFPAMDFGHIAMPVFDDRAQDSAFRTARGLAPNAPLPPQDPTYPFKYHYKGTIRNLTNDTVLLVIRNPAKKVDERSGERTLTSAISIVEGNNMRLGPNATGSFTIQLETTTNELVRRSLNDAMGHIYAQEEARLEAVAAAEAQGESPPKARRFVMDLVERLRVDVVGASEPLVLRVKASLVLNASLKDSTVPKPEVHIKI